MNVPTAEYDNIVCPCCGSGSFDLNDYDDANEQNTHIATETRACGDCGAIYYAELTYSLCDAVARKEAAV